MTRIACAAVLSLAGMLRCGAPQSGGQAGAGPGEPDAGTDGGVQTSGWTIAFQEDFEALAAPAVTWQAAGPTDDGPYADDGLYFRRQGVTPPPAPGMV